jgi:pyruvate formate lyase activating enzyme
MMWDRRQFLTRCAAAVTGFCIADRCGCLDAWPSEAIAQDVFRGRAPKEGKPKLADFRAAHWESIGEKGVVCRLCPRECRVPDQKRGFCGVRWNDGGVYKSLIHSRVCAAHVDPIEKKPFFHVMPGTKAFSISSSGCNLDCRFCQNWEISQVPPEELPMAIAPPEQIPLAAQDAKCRLIAHTYTEPFVGWEYVRDVADASKVRGIPNVVVSAGYIQEKPLREIIPRLAAVKIDLKGFTDNYYREVVNGELHVIQRTLEILKETGRWFEIVTLVVPTLNDDEDSMRRLCGWVAERLGPEVPIHFTRFHPAYRLQNLPSTPIRTLERIHGYAREAGLLFAYLGNVPGHPAENTYCPDCGEVVIRRTAYTIIEDSLIDGRCSKCKRPIPGVWS